MLALGFTLIGPFIGGIIEAQTEGWAELTKTAGILLILAYPREDSLIISSARGCKMETFQGRAHLPGAEKEWDLVVEIDWVIKEINIHIDEAAEGVTDWPGLVVQTFGSEEVLFRTKGIPQAFTHWWHFVRSGGGDLWGIVLALPDVDGIWKTCPLILDKVS